MLLSKYLNTLGRYLMLMGRTFQKPMDAPMGDGLHHKRNYAA